MPSGSRQRGFTYLSALFLTAFLGAGLAAIAEIWSHARQREKEAELLWIGNQFRQAIALYYYRTPGSSRRYPESLAQLIEDNRFPTPQRYLRRVYVDPMLGKAEWGLVSAPGGGLAGVHSLSTSRPIRKEFDGAVTYLEWRFVFEPSSASTKVLHKGKQ